MIGLIKQINSKEIIPLLKFIYKRVHYKKTHFLPFTVQVETCEFYEIESKPRMKQLLTQKTIGHGIPMQTISILELNWLNILSLKPCKLVSRTLPTSFFFIYKYIYKYKGWEEFQQSNSVSAIVAICVLPICNKRIFVSFFLQLGDL